VEAAEEVEAVAEEVAEEVAVEEAAAAEEVEAVPPGARGS